MLNKRALITFLAITFGLTLIAISIARCLGFTMFSMPNVLMQLVIAASMFFPALGAILTQILIVKKPLKELGFKFGPWKMYMIAYLIILIIYLMNYTITWIFFQKPDWSLASFINQFSLLTPDMKLPFPAPMMILLLTAVTFLFAPIFNMIPCLGEEIGWRGFLLPHLEPLGKVKAMVFSSMIWALWHTPMILILGFVYGSEAFGGALLHFMAVTGLGIWIGYFWFKTRSTILAGFMHAVINAHAYGIWTLLFVSENKLVVGAVGFIGTTLFVLLGLITLYITNKRINPITEKIKV